MEALSDQTVQRVQLLNDLNSDITVTRKLDLALNGFTVTGNVVFNHNESGTITMEQGTIQGDLTVNTPGATVINKANVTGTASIQDVADNTFDNSGQLKKLEVTDPNGARIINRGASLIETFIIDSPAPIELSGSFETIEILQDSFLTLAENTTLDELKAEETVSVEVIKPASVEIKVAPPQMRESELQLDDATVVRKVHGLIERMKPFLEKDLSDEAVVNQFIELSSEASELSGILYQKDPRGTLTQQLLGESGTISNKFFELIPTPEDLGRIFNDFKIEIVDATKEEGAHFVFPEVPEGIRFYLSSDYQVTEKYMIPTRPSNDDEMRHVFVSYTFSKGNKHLSKKGFFHIPSGDGEITFELMGPNEYFMLGDYTNGKDFQLSKEGYFMIKVTEGKTVGELLNSALLAERKKQVTLSVFERPLKPFTITGEYHLELSKQFNLINYEIVQDNELDENDLDYVSIDEAGFILDEKSEILRYKGEITSNELQWALKEDYLKKHPEENSDYLNINFVRFLTDEDELKSGYQLISESEHGNEGIYRIEMMPNQ